jgi:hypothetical protein
MADWMKRRVGSAPLQAAPLQGKKRAKEVDAEAEADEAEAEEERAKQRLKQSKQEELARLRAVLEATAKQVAALEEAAAAGGE